METAETGRNPLGVKALWRFDAPDTWICGFGRVVKVAPAAGWSTGWKWVAYPNGIPTSHMAGSLHDGMMEVERLGDFKPIAPGGPIPEPKTRAVDGVTWVCDEYGKTWTTPTCNGPCYGHVEYKPMSQAWGVYAGGKGLGTAPTMDKALELATKAIRRTADRVPMVQTYTDPHGFVWTQSSQDPEAWSNPELGTVSHGQTLLGDDKWHMKGPDGYKYGWLRGRDNAMAYLFQRWSAKKATAPSAKDVEKGLLDALATLQGQFNDVVKQRDNAMGLQNATADARDSFKKAWSEARREIDQNKLTISHQSAIISNLEGQLKGKTDQVANQAETIKGLYSQIDSQAAEQAAEVDRLKAIVSAPGGKGCEGCREAVKLAKRERDEAILKASCTETHLVVVKDDLERMTGRYNRAEFARRSFENKLSRLDRAMETLKTALDA